jgi:3-hydroxyisobutyrate dehydrogenase-like beta-hydroxyacid dehydrogenase
MGAGKRMIKIGFIGIGAMGYPIAKHLLSAGYKINLVKHSDNEVSLSRIDELVKNGASIMNKTSDLPLHSDIIMCILPGGKEVKEVLINENFRKNTSEDTIIIDMTSCSPDTILEVGQYYANKKVFLIDAPVSGGIVKAQEGNLTIFGSGEKIAFDRIFNILNVFGEEIYYVGKLGNGKTIKAVNQMMVAVNMMGAAEAIKIISKTELEVDKVYDIIRKCSGNSYIFEKYFKKIIDEDFEPGFKLKLMKKDLNVALDLNNGSQLPVSEFILKLISQTDEYDEKDFSVMGKLTEEDVLKNKNKDY